MDYKEQSHILAIDVVTRLQTARQTLGLAESCSGGRIAASITHVPGCSDVFLGGVVSYANSAKHALLGVDSTLLAQHGAVSEPVAAAMALGARAAFGSDWSIAVTGIAGPGGGSADKPVGLVYIAWAGPAGSRIASASTQRCLFSGEREAVQWQSVETALQGLLEFLGH